MLYITTRGRVNKQITFDNLSPNLQKRTVLAVVASEAKQYDKRYPLWIYPDKHGKVLGHARQYIMQMHDIKKHGDKLFLLDDDLRFAARSKEDRKKFVPATPKDLDKAFAFMETLLESYPQVAISSRNMAQDKDDIEVDTRAILAVGWDVTTYRWLKLKYDRLTCMSDFDITLQLLTSGFSNAQITTIVCDQPGSNTEGGCSRYRTLEVLAKAAQSLQLLFPKYVKLVEKETKHAWGGGKRTDVTIQWKKARRRVG